MKTLAIVCAVISGASLATIVIRKRVPLVGGLVSREARAELDRTDKRLALAGLLFFLLCIAFLIAGFPY